MCIADVCLYCGVYVEFCQGLMLYVTVSCKDVNMVRVCGWNACGELQTLSNVYKCWLINNAVLGISCYNDIR